MYLVGLYIYYKMIHGPYNVKLIIIIINSGLDRNKSGDYTLVMTAKTK